MSDSDLPTAPRWVSAASRVIRSLPAGRYRAMNWVARRSAAPFWAALPDDFGGLLFRCDLRDLLMREVCITGRYEPQETLLLQEFLRPGMTFVDVGANWGYFTLAAAHLVGPTGRVLSIEADPRASRILSSNVGKNALTQVIVLSTAASDTTAIIKVRRYGAGNDESANFGVALANAVDSNEEGQRRSLEIQARPLEAILDDHGIERVDLLKMDIEGAEARALLGVRRRLEQGLIDRIILELHPALLRNHGSDAAAIVQQLQELGYNAWRIDHDPSVHRRSASTRVDVGSSVTLLGDSDELGEWPHVLFARQGLGRSANSVKGR